MSAGAEGGLSYLSLRRPSTRPRSPTYARQNGWCRASVIFKPETLESMYEFLPTWRSVIFRDDGVDSAICYGRGASR
jgi:hypothetical protein